MASRYTQEYFFQHTLMNVSFTNLNKIIHPNAESIPEYIRHYASAMFDHTKVIQELEMEGHRQDYIDSYMSYMKMLKSTYNLVTKGKTFFLTWIHKLIKSISSFIFLHSTYRIFNILGIITISNINKKNTNSFSFMLYLGYYYYINIIYWFFCFTYFCRSLKWHDYAWSFIRLHIVIVSK